MPLVNKSFSDLITFTRSTGGGRFNAQGQYEWLPANTPRIDYDPVTGECLGLLIEEQRTNLLTYSDQLDVSTWQNVGFDISRSGPLSPLGNLSWRMVNQSSGAYFLQPVNSGGATVFTGGYLLKRGDHDWIRIHTGTDVGSVNGSRVWFNLATGAVGTKLTVGTATAVSAKIRPCGDGWYFCSVTTTVPSSAFAVAILAASVADNNTSRPPNGSFFYAAAAQLEAGSFPTSYIPTTNAQVTRAADIASVNELSPWYNAEQGTLFVEWSKLADKAFQAVVTMASDTANFVSVGHGGDGKLLRVDIYENATANANLTAVQSTTAGIIYRTAYSLSETGLAVSTNGSPAVEDTSILLPSVAHMLIGGAVVASNRQLNGYIRSLRFYPRRLSDESLVELTTP